MAPSLVDTEYYSDTTSPMKIEKKHVLKEQDQYGHYHPSPPHLLKLESNFGAMDPEMIGYLQPTLADTNLEVMRERFQRDGYLHVKGLIPKADIHAVRRAYFEHMAPSELTKPDTDALEGIYCGADHRRYLPPGNLRRLFGLPNDELSDKYVELMISAHEAPFYLDLCANEHLHNFVRKFMSWDQEIMLQRSMLRAFVPNSELTPVHYDQMYLRGGPPTSLTAWVPLGNVSLEGGGLMYLENSVPIGQETEAEFASNATNLTDEERVSAFNKNMSDGGFLSRDTKSYGKEKGRKWLITEYEVGDVIFHNPFLVHASCKNKDPENRIRLATDLRFVDSTKDYDKRWMKVYRPLDGL